MTTPSQTPNADPQPPGKDSDPTLPPAAHDRVPVYSTPGSSGAVYPGYHHGPSLLQPPAPKANSLLTAAMCAPNHNALLSYAGLKVPAPSPYFALNPAASQLSALDFHRSQYCDYRQLLGFRQYQALHASGLGTYAAAYLDPYAQYLYKGDPRGRFVQEEPKPAHSYIGLIAMAILSSKDKKLVLSDIYQWILDNYPYFRTRGPGWRNSIRHNLSLNDCFIKSGRSANGKGHYWAVHPANVDDFTRGDFRRRRAQRKVRKHMGLAVPDDDDDSPSPSPNPINWAHSGQDARKDSSEDYDNNNISADGGGGGGERDGGDVASVSGAAGSEGLPSRGFLPLAGCGSGVAHVSKKRQFDMESLLAPDYPVVVVPKVRLLAPSAAPSSPAHQRHSDMDSTTSEPRQGCLSDDSDVDIEVEDIDDNEEDADTERRAGENDQLHAASDHNPAEEAELSGAEDVEIKTADDSEISDDHQPSSQSHSSASATTLSSSSFSAGAESSSSALDLSSSSSPTVTSMSVMSASPAQTLVLPSAGQRARWMSLGMGLGGVGLGTPSAELGLRRYSAFHAAGAGNPGLRGSLAPSVASFLHPVFAAARYPPLVPLGASATPGVMGSDPSERSRSDDASQGTPERV